MARTKDSLKKSSQTIVPVRPDVSKKPKKAKKTSITLSDGSAMALKRRHRFKPGTVADREIRKLQKANSPEFLVPKAPFDRLVRELMGQFGDYRVTPGTLYALRAAGEAEIDRMMSSANRMAIHADRVTLMLKDIDAVTDVREIYPDDTMRDRKLTERYLTDRKARREKALAKYTKKRATLKNRVTEVATSEDESAANKPLAIEQAY